MHYIISLTTRSSRASRRNENGNEFACEELVSLLRGSSRSGRWQPLHCFRIDESLSVCSQFTKPNLPEISREKPWIMSCCSSNNIGARGFEIDLLHRVVIHSAQWVILPLFCTRTLLQPFEFSRAPANHVVLLFVDIRCVNKARWR